MRHHCCEKRYCSFQGVDKFGCCHNSSNRSRGQDADFRFSIRMSLRRVAGHDADSSTWSNQTNHSNESQRHIWEISISPTNCTVTLDESLYWCGPLLSHRRSITHDPHIRIYANRVRQAGNAPPAEKEMQQKAQSTSLPLSPPPRAISRKRATSCTAIGGGAFVPPGIGSTSLRSPSTTRVKCDGRRRRFYPVQLCLDQSLHFNRQAAVRVHRHDHLHAHRPEIGNAVLTNDFYPLFPAFEGLPKCVRNTDTAA